MRTKRSQLKLRISDTKELIFEGAKVSKRQGEKLVLFENNSSNQNSRKGTGNSPSKEFSPEEIANKISQGDKSAENELIRFYQASLRYILRRKFYDKQLIEDVFQDTFCVVISKLRAQEIKNPKGLASFIRTTAIYLGNDYIRKEKKTQPNSDTSLFENLLFQEKPQSTQIDNAELSALVREVIQELRKSRDREVLLRFYLDQTEKKFICEEMSLSPEQFDRVIHRARSRLKDRLLSHNKLSVFASLFPWLNNYEQEC